MSQSISGFPEYSPAETLAFLSLLDRIKDRFRLYGFSPMDTRAVEKTSALLSKGEDKEIYGIYRLAGEGENSKKDLALRFDLTVPLARYVAENYGSLTFPFKRYHIGQVWRGERPKAGRYRQFYQCDLDVVSEKKLSLSYDSEMISVLYETLESLGIKNFTVKVNDSVFLARFVESFGVPKGAVQGILRSIDKADKISREELYSLLEGQGAPAALPDSLFKPSDLSMSNSETFDFFRKNLTGSGLCLESLENLEKIMGDASNLFSVPERFIKFAPSLARGLNYYTGSVYEAVCDDFPELGSVASGGRYSDLVGSFINKELPGVGLSIGISRLFPKMLENGLLKADSSTPAKILVTRQDPDLTPEYIKIAAELRKSGIATECFLEEFDLSKQMKYAAKKGFKFVLIAGKVEIGSGTWIIRDMETGGQKILDLDSAKDFLSKAE